MLRHDVGDKILVFRFAAGMDNAMRLEEVAAAGDVAVVFQEERGSFAIRDTDLVKIRRVRHVAGGQSAPSDRCDRDIRYTTDGLR